MAELEIASEKLIVHITGVDKFFALASRLEVPLEHISSVAVNPAEAHGVWHGLRMGGTNVPGLITAGRFLQGAEWAFWDVHDPSRSIAVYLHDESYARIVIGVDDPEAAAAAIRGAIGT
ncbi:MAG TPA: hypothetical protein VJT78_11625 [Candidatus Dormibacteraeota bacterium]|nr:hypothetical protein [Candidatus Dormibacteraeota bacterium]